MDDIEWHLDLEYKQNTANILYGELLIRIYFWRAAFSIAVSDINTYEGYSHMKFAIYFDILFVNIKNVAPLVAL